MCNNCECENEEKCSIKGTIPIGWCCPKCKDFDEEHTCIKLKVKKMKIK